MRTFTLLTHATVGALAIVMVGCATTVRAPTSRTVLEQLTERDNLPGTPGCFWKSDFQGDWTVLNETTLIVRAPLPKNAYVVKLFAPVTGLGFMQRLGFEDQEQTGRICDNGSDYLVIPDTPRRVPIVAIHALSKVQQQQLLEAAGKLRPKPGADHQAAPPKS